MLSLVRARLAHPAARLLQVGASVNSPSTLFKARLLLAGGAQLPQRGIAFSAPIWEPAAKKKTAGRSKTTAGRTKAKTSVAAKKKPVKKAKKATKAAVKAKPRKKKVVSKAAPKSVSRAMRAELKPPKRSPGPYGMFFSKFVKASKLPKSNMQEVNAIAKEAANVWNSFSEIEKQPFLHDHQIATEAYRKSMVIWSEKALKNHVAYIRINRQRALKKKPVYRLDKSVRRPASSFLQFCSAIRPTLPAGAVSEQVKEASRLWKDLTPSEKKVYSDKYHKELLQWRQDHGFKGTHN